MKRENQMSSKSFSSGFPLQSLLHYNMEFSHSPNKYHRNTFWLFPSDVSDESGTRMWRRGDHSCSFAPNQMEEEWAQIQSGRSLFESSPSIPLLKVSSFFLPSIRGEKNLLIPTRSSISWIFSFQEEEDEKERPDKQDVFGVPAHTVHNIRHRGHIPKHKYTSSRFFLETTTGINRWKDPKLTDDKRLE